MSITKFAFYSDKVVLFYLKMHNICTHFLDVTNITCLSHIHKSIFIFVRS